MGIDFPRVLLLMLDKAAMMGLLKTGSAACTVAPACSVHTSEQLSLCAPVCSLQSPIAETIAYLLTYCHQ